MYFPGDIYFPRNVEEVEGFIWTLKGKSIRERLDLVDRELRYMAQKRDEVDPDAIKALCDYRMFLMEESEKDSGHLYQWELEYERLEQTLKELLMVMDEKDRQLNFITADLKSYKNLYIFILSHPGNNSSVIAEILSKISFLNHMTRDVTFIMPGYKSAKEDDVVVNENATDLRLTFDEKAFIETVQDLEDKSCGAYMYNHKCELLFVGAKPDGNYDFTSFVRLDMDLLYKKRGIDPVGFILQVAQNFRIEAGKSIPVDKYVRQILGKMTMEEEQQIVRVFIAGSKQLKIERSLLREELSKVENILNLNIRSLTFEDFATSLTGEDGGRQKYYNDFISNEADLVVFIFDSGVGQITAEEFDVAYESLKLNKHPEVFVYSKKKSFQLFPTVANKKLKEIHDKVFGYHKEYFVEYKDQDELRYLFYSNMISYFRAQFNK